MISISEIKIKAKNQLGNNVFGTIWLTTLIAMLICDAIIGVSSMFVIGSLIITGPVNYGLARFLLKTARNNETKFENLFSGFKEDLTNSIILGFISQLFIFLWTMLFIIPGIVKSYSYAMAPFIQQDESDKSWKNCLDKSRQIMYGHKLQLFILDLSFIGWYIVGALCFGIGILFVVPYHQQARAIFYEEIRTNTTV